jgi:MFS family permease
MNGNRRLIIILIAAVLTTGFSALLYQVVWQRMLGLFSGSDVRSVTIVTSAFLAGLGVGSLAGSFIADRFTSRQSVIAYGLCNLGIGAFAFLSRYLYYNVLFLELNTLAESPLVLLLVVFISLLIPTTLMGLSLPLLSKAVVRNMDNAARIISLLYGFNTLGAGLGTVVSGWYLIGTFGYEVSVYIGAFLSTAVGITALSVSGRFRQDSGDAVAHRQKVSLWRVPRPVWIWCGLVFVSGFIAISLEIIWFRILDVVLKSNAYTFAHLLAFFLVGDALGSLVGSRLVHRVQHPRRAFLWIQGVVALYSALIIWGIALSTSGYPLNDYIRDTGSQLALTLEDNKLQWFVYMMVPAVMLLPSSFLIGFYYPIVQKAVQTDPGVVGQRVGLIDVCNIAGNTLGGILTGTVVLHWGGTSTALRIILVLGLVFMGVLLYENRAVFRLSWRLAGGFLAAGLLATSLFFPAGDALWRRLHAIQDDELFWVAEDSSGVSAIREADGLGWIYANGRHQGHIPFSEVHSFLGALPALVHPNPQNILVIGIGSAGTPYAVGVNPATQSIRAVEIIGSELDVLESYARSQSLSVIQQFLNDPRYELIIGDGRRELVFSDQPYDIIEADAILPVSSHSGLLYSREYFETARNQLAADGIMAQWRPTQRVERTFAEVFPYVVVVDVYLLGSKSPIPYDPETVINRLADPEIIAYLEAGGIDIEALRSLIQPPVRVWTPDTPREFQSDDLNTDLFPRDEYYLNNPY